LFGIDEVLELDDFAPASGFELETGGGAGSTGSGLLAQPAIAAVSSARPMSFAGFIKNPGMGRLRRVSEILSGIAARR
jgi:hypothetical protein